MIPKKNDSTIGNLFQFSPYIFFLSIYFSLYCYILWTKNSYNSSTIMLAGLPLFVAFISTIYAFFTFKAPLSIDKKIEIFLSGVAHNTAMNSYFIIIFIAIFNYMIAKINGVLIAVTLGLLYIPTSWVMPAMFLLASKIAILLRSLPATIIIFMPIAHGIAQSLQIDPAFMAATILSGALYGNHISLYFHSIIADIKSNQLNIQSFFQKNTWIILPAAIIALFIISHYQCEQINPTVYHHLEKSLTIRDFINLIPYFFLLIASFLNLNLLANLIIACLIAFIIEIISYKVMFIDTATTMFNGFCGESIIVNLLLLHLIVAGLVQIIKYNGGFDYIIKKFQPKERINSSKFEFRALIITMMINLFVIIDTLSFQVITEFIEKLSEKYNASQSKITNMIHITSSIMQTILPYSSIMFLTIYLSKHSFFEIMNYMIYPGLIIILTTISIIISACSSYTKAQYKKLNI
ncbi:MAG: hypothetical protein JO129_02025 [Candidatus Dependentiae bacterium]|nr:hypothetical protein [Candidatus Dependentiae bacterium]